MAFSKIEHCLISDAIRPEERGKLALLGFLGVCPHVEITVSTFGTPLQLGLVFLGGPGDDKTYDVIVEVLDSSKRSLFPGRPSVKATAKSTMRTTLVFEVVTVFRDPGEYFVRLSVSGKTWFETSFKMSLLKP